MFSRGGHAYWLILYYLIASLVGYSAIGQEHQIELHGTLLDSLSLQPIPAASVFVELDASMVGTASEEDGTFRLVLERDLLPDSLLSLQVSCLGYTPRRLEVALRSNLLQLGPITLSASDISIDPIVVRSERYIRKHNPALRILREVIRRKEERAKVLPKSHQLYHKTLLAQAKIDPTHGYWEIPKEEMPRFVDSSAWLQTNILPLSLRERILEVYSQGSQQIVRLRGHRYHGAELIVSDGWIGNDIDALFPPIDIYADHIPLLSKRIVGPLNQSIGPLYYRYYLLDSQTTLGLDGSPCYHIQFVPRELHDVALLGQLWIDTLDYQVRYAEFRVPSSANINWVDRLYTTIDFSPYSRRLGRDAQDVMTIWLPHHQSTSVLFRFGVKNTLSGLLNKEYHYFDYSDTAAHHNQSYIPPLDTLRSLGAGITEQYGFIYRPIPLTTADERAVALVDYMQSDVRYRLFSYGARLFALGYVPLPWRGLLDPERTLFEFGPLETILSANKLEGVRLRLGGRTRPRLHPHLFVEGYLTYGTCDRRWKYYLQLAFTPQRKLRDSREYPIDSYSVEVQRDLFIPGEKYMGLDKDGLTEILSSYGIRRRYYADRYRVMHDKEWTPAWRTSIWGEFQNRQPTGDLYFRSVDQMGDTITLSSVSYTELGASIRWIPGRTRISGRSDIQLVTDPYLPTITLSCMLYPKGLWGNVMTYAQLQFSYLQRLSLSALGIFDCALQGGYSLGNVPEDHLFSPYGRYSWLQLYAPFYTLRPLEYIADRYLDCSVLYRMQGILFNRIPHIQKWGLRELLGVHAYWGYLADTDFYKPNYQLLLPNYTHPMKGEVHIELSIGIENIFHLFTLQYFYRPTGGDDLPWTSRHAMRLGVQFIF